MAALTLNSIRLCSLALGAALALAQPALAGDVSVKLDAGTGFSIKSNTGYYERLRVDEATGNVSRNGVLFIHTTGGNTFVGERAGNLATPGNGNSAFGLDALRFNDGGSRNAAFGFLTLRSNTTGGGNNAIGYKALYSNTGGLDNSAVGFVALVSNTTGIQNVAFGSRTLADNTTGTRNSAFGDTALSGNTTGDRNIGLGYSAGANHRTGSDNIYLANAGVSAESGTIRIGTSPVTHTRTFIAGIRAVTTGLANAVPVLIDGAGQLGTVSSSRSAKKEIRDMGDATAPLLDLRPVTFRYKQEQTLPSGGEVPPEYGLIAEEVAEVFPDLVVYDENGQPFTVKYHEMAPMLLNEMKKEHRANLEQQRTIEAQQQEIAALTSRLARLEAHAR